MDERQLLDFAAEELGFYLDVNLDKAGMLGRLRMFAL